MSYVVRLGRSFRQAPATGDNLAKGKSYESVDSDRRRNRII